MPTDLDPRAAASHVRRGDRRHPARALHPAAPQLALEAAAQVARDAGLAVHILGDSVATGPTLTNVNDFRAILVR